VEFELVIFDCQQINPLRLQHDIASRLGLGVEASKETNRSFKSRSGKSFCANGNLVGLGVDHRAAK